MRTWGHAGKAEVIATESSRLQPSIGEMCGPARGEDAGSGSVTEGVDDPETADDPAVLEIFGEQDIRPGAQCDLDDQGVPVPNAPSEASFKGGRHLLDGFGAGESGDAFRRRPGKITPGGLSARLSP